MPASTLGRVIEQLGTRGHIARGYLGLAMQGIALPHALGGGSGVIALGIAEGGPADHGGLIVGDIIVTLLGRRIEDTDDVAAALESVTVGAPAVVGLLRGGKPLDITLTIGERPNNDD